LVDHFGLLAIAQIDEKTFPILVFNKKVSFLKKKKTLFPKTLQIAKYKMETHYKNIQ
jgi:hypothetical protein